MKCKVCGIPTLPEWDDIPPDICGQCRREKNKIIYFQKQEARINRPKYSHVCKSCFTPLKHNNDPTLFEALLSVFLSDTFCPKCNRNALIPTDTPKGKKILNELGITDNDA